MGPRLSPGGGMCTPDGEVNCLVWEPCEGPCGDEIPHNIAVFGVKYGHEFTFLLYPSSTASGFDFDTVQVHHVDAETGKPVATYKVPRGVDDEWSTMELRSRTGLVTRVELLDQGVVVGCQQYNFVDGAEAGGSAGLYRHRMNPVSGGV